MKKFLIIIIAVFLYGDLYTNKNIQILNSLDIENSFINNKKLNYLYKIYSKRKKNYFLNLLENGYDYLPLIRNQIISSKIPKELISVAFAESYLNIDAKSNKRAIGLWQFMPVTAKRFGLRINEYVDERKDAVKSTKAAIEYLKNLHKFFGKWYLAVMAYNAGEARIVEAVVRAKVDKLCKKLGKKCKRDKTIKKYRKIIKNYQRHGRYAYAPLHKLYLKLKKEPLSLNGLLKYQRGLKRQYLPKETRKYILKILAMSFLFNSDEFIKYSNSYLLNSGVTASWEKVEVPPGTSLIYVSRLLHVSLKDLREHNYHLNYIFTPPYKYYIYIPYEKLAYFKLHFNPKKHFFVYKIKKGDTLGKIAKRFDTKIRLIRDFNKIGKFLHIGQKLVIPLNSVFVSYKVKKGDSLRKIARKYGVSFNKIKKINNLKSSLIRIGEVLKIPQEFK
ncbi:MULTISPECIES: lytic transglycosylase domain-containing protein [unclassified Lebetimonas]|uniref:lytic transglycosylase domain-containing protein n=1 Tax=unclassified Lebetimonas TaxID=2648158 RepID=UPI00046534F0|nr:MULTISPECIES: lytic transglycosylase domain-containing protein [unclassified Lebetimonas]